ncbi:MAG: hypothetical protein KDN22_28785 [Verrucomicrobiae bacterium]|nr:hypothetical protein [Verrucomicrobiae bacterium]
MPKTSINLAFPHFLRKSSESIRINEPSQITGLKQSISPSIFILNAEKLRKIQDFSLFLTQMLYEKQKKNDGLHVLFPFIPTYLVDPEKNAKTSLKIAWRAFHIEKTVLIFARK